MGLNEQTESGKRWNYPPKKKWKDCYMLFGGIKEQLNECPKETLTPEKYVAQPVLPQKNQNVVQGNELDDAPYLSTSLTSSPNPKSVASNSCQEPVVSDWSIIQRPELEDVKPRNKVHVLTTNSGPLAGLRGALQAHSDQRARAKEQHDDQGIGLYSFKPVEVQDEGRDTSACGTVVATSRLGGNFIPTNGIIHTVNQVPKELCTVKDELDRKRISMSHVSSRDASLRSTPSREVHNKLEKNRRAHLKECFELLRRQLPSMEDKKISNQTILKAAFRYIQTLRRKERDLEHEMERLARAKIALQQNVSSLKKELQSKYDHMDFSTIIPDSTALEQMQDKDTKSTTTASEQPDYEEQNAISDIQMSDDHSSPYQSVDYGDRPKLVRSESDYDQPLNLSTAQTCRSDVEMPEWEEPPLQNDASSSNLPKVSYFYEDTCNLVNDNLISTHVPAALTGSHFTQISLPSVIGALPPVAGQLTPVAASLTAASSSQVSQIVKGGNSLSHQLGSIAKVMTLPSNHVNSTESHSLVNSHYSPNMPQLTVSGNVGRISGINGTTITRLVSTNPSSFPTTAVASPESHAIPLVGGSGLHIPAQLLTNNVHLSTHTGSIISPQSIQMITPEGYKLVPADGTLNGGKPVTILAQSDGLESLSEDGKAGPFMVSVNKNGLSAFHLAVPAAVTRTISASQGTTMPMTSVPLNLTVGGTSSIKVTQAGSASLLPSYIPLANSNGLTRLLPGMSVVAAPLMVSSPQRNVMLPTVSTKSQGSTAGTLVPAQYPSGLLNSVVVVSTATSAGTSSNTAANKQ